MNEFIAIIDYRVKYPYETKSLEVWDNLTLEQIKFLKDFSAYVLDLECQLIELVCKD